MPLLSPSQTWSNPLNNTYQFLHVVYRVHICLIIYSVRRCVIYLYWKQITSNFISWNPQQPTYSFICIPRMPCLFLLTAWPVLTMGFLSSSKKLSGSIWVEVETLSLKWKTKTGILVSSVSYYFHMLIFRNTRNTAFTYQII